MKTWFFFVEDIVFGVVGGNIFFAENIFNGENMFFGENMVLAGNMVLGENLVFGKRKKRFLVKT